MNEFPDDNVSPAPLLEHWMQAYSEFWSKALAMWAPDPESIPESRLPLQDSEGRLQESWKAGMRSLQVMVSSMQKPEAMEALFKGVGTVPQVQAKVLSAAWEAFFHLQEDWMARASRIGKSTTAYKFENLDQEAFKAWLEVYDKEFRHFLHVPQLGLTRFYQERGSKAVDKFNILQATMAEFISLLYLPVEKSLKVMQEELATMADRGNLPESSKDLYRMWIKALEGHYMTLFKSASYTHSLGKTLDAMSDFMVAKNEILQDALQVLPVATRKEMDELYREIYLLKKMVKELAKKNRSAEHEIATEEQALTPEIAENAVCPEDLSDEAPNSSGSVTMKAGTDD